MKALEIAGILTRAEWTQAQRAHEARARQWVEPHLRRRTRGESHPVWDFLFDYYRLRPSHLTRWQPGPGVRLLDATAPPSSPAAGWRDYRVNADGSVELDTAALLARRGAELERVRTLLMSISNASPHYDCFGLHEWAMVYRTGAPRHGLDLRLGVEGTNRVVEKHRLKCSHFDAYRFFTPAARPLNLTVLTREGQAGSDQSGCVHVTMDLYKWASKMGPSAPGELLLDCFELARDARRLDMEASPYDCRPLGFGVVAIETVEGKAEYVRRQRELSARAEPLRTRLVALLDMVLTDKMTGK